jgi:hypothetical protein
MTSTFIYPRTTLLADYARASVGLVFAAIAIFLPLHWGLALVFGLIAALLLFFGGRTAVRQLSRVELSEDGIALAGPFGRKLAWQELDGLRLRYFSMRRDRQHGWMELTLSGAGRRIRLESQIEGFEVIVTRAGAAAAARRVTFDDPTATNLAAMGIDIPKVTAPGDSRRAR